MEYLKACPKTQLQYLWFRMQRMLPTNDYGRDGLNPLYFNIVTALIVTSFSQHTILKCRL